MINTLWEPAASCICRGNVSEKRISQGQHPVKLNVKYNTKKTAKKDTSSKFDFAKVLNIIVIQILMQHLLIQVKRI